MIAFEPKGPLLSFTAASSAPTSVQAVSLTGESAQQYVLNNTSSTIDVTVGWGATDAEAKLNAAAGSSVKKCYYLMRGTIQVVTGPPNAFFSGISVSSSALIYVQNGIGN